jgi:hypothetical protein
MDYHYLSSSGKHVFRGFRESNLAPRPGRLPAGSGAARHDFLIRWERSMPDRSSHQGLPDEWNHGSHAAPGPFSGAGSADGYGASATGAHRARTADGYGTGPNEIYGVAQADALGVRPDTFVVRPTGTYGTGAADPFGDADPFGSRTGDPFGPATTAPFSAVTTEARPEAEHPVGAISDPMSAEATDTRGFLGALFDFGFTSFVTPKVIKVLYMLIVIGTIVSALVFTIVVFKASVMFGFLMLVFGDPLFILITLAIYRVILEFFVITFRVAEDIRALREGS